MLARLPAAQLSQITAAIDSKFATLGESMINQMAVATVKAEYAALGMDTEKLQTDYILHIGILMLLLTLLSGACTIVVGYLSARTAAGVARDLRRSVFQQVESFSSTEFDKFSTASLITRSTNDITQIQMVVDHDDAHGLLRARSSASAASSARSARAPPCGGSSPWRWSSCSA